MVSMKMLPSFWMPPVYHPGRKHPLRRSEENLKIFGPAPAGPGLQKPGGAAIMDPAAVPQAAWKKKIPETETVSGIWWTIQDLNCEKSSLSSPGFSRNVLFARDCGLG